MKILLLLNTDVLAFPAIIQLHGSGKLSAVAIPEKNAHIVTSFLDKTGVDKDHIYSLKKQSFKEQIAEIAHKHEADVLYVIGFPWLIPDETLTLFKHGGINLHFGLLPKYKGADPIFWEIKNREKEGGISVHQMTNELDAGMLLLQQRVPIIPGETYGLYGQRLGSILPELLPEIEKNILSKTYLDCNNEAAGAYMDTPTPIDLTIDWNTQTAAEIEWLVNAANPKYSGAISSLRGNTIYILEVSPAEVSNSTPSPPGTIVYADGTYGIIIQCINNEFLKLNVARINEAFISGIKLFNLGVRPGEAFT